MSTSQISTFTHTHTHTHTHIRARARAREYNLFEPSEIESCFFG